MRNVKTFPSKHMYPYLSLVERKVAEFYHNIDRRRWLVWLKWLIFITFSGQSMVSLLNGNNVFAPLQLLESYMALNSTSCRWPPKPNFTLIESQIQFWWNFCRKCVKVALGTIWFSFNLLGARLLDGRWRYHSLNRLRPQTHFDQEVIIITSCVFATVKFKLSAILLNMPLYRRVSEMKKKKTSWTKL